MEMIIYIIDTFSYLYGTDGILPELPHASGIFDAHFGMELRYICGALTFVRLLDVVVAETVGIRQIHAAFDAIPGHKSSGNNEVEFQVLEGILGQLSQTGLIHQGILAQFFNLFHITGFNGAVEFYLRIIRGTVEFILTLHKLFVK
jgi:hypothetical protein